MTRLKQQISELNFSKNFAQKTINWARWQLFQDLKASKARPSMVFFIITNFIYVVVKKIRRYFNFSLKSILFLSLITANFASLEKPRSCLTLTYCVSKHLWRSDVLSVKIQWIISFLINVTFPQVLFYIFCWCKSFAWFLRKWKIGCK